MTAVTGPNASTVWSSGASGEPARSAVGAEDGAVERVGLGVEADRLADHSWMGAQAPGRGRRAGEGDRVLPGQVVEQVADAAAQQLDGARREQARLDHVAEGE